MELPLESNVNVNPTLKPGPVEGYVGSAVLLDLRGIPTAPHLHPGMRRPIVAANTKSAVRRKLSIAAQRHKNGNRRDQNESSRHAHHFLKAPRALSRSLMKSHL